MQNISEIETLIKLISKLPGLGPKSARRIILKLINNREEILKPMSKALSDILKNILRCNSCGALKSNNSICANCEENKETFPKRPRKEKETDVIKQQSATLYSAASFAGGTDWSI